MKFLKKLFKLDDNITTKDDYPTLILVEHMVLVDEETKKPYFIVSPNGSHSFSKLYLSEFINNTNKYKSLFSVNDYGHIMFCVGGLHSMELNNIYQITSFELDGKIIEVRHKGTLIHESWNIAEVIATQKYLLLDKASILKLGMLFEKNTGSNYSTEIFNDSTNDTHYTKLKLVK